MRNTFAIITLCIFALMGGTACGSEPKPEPTPAPAPKTASNTVPTSSTSNEPKVEFTRADGSAFTVADLKGKAKVVNFWATWCAPCIGEMPTLSAMAKKHEANGVDFLAVSLDEEGPSKVEPMLKQNKFKIDFPVAYAKFQDVQPYEVGTSLPHTLVFDASNKLVQHFEGVVKEAELEAAIQKALSGTTSAP